MSPLFSRQSLLSLDALFREKAIKVVDMMLARSRKGEPSNVLYAFRCMTMDVISLFARPLPSSGPA